MKALTHKIAVLTGVSLLALPAAAFAQAQAVPGAQGETSARAVPAGQPTTEAQAETTPGEIVVTALKREQTLLTVPAAVSVLGGDNLRTQGVNNLTDIQNIVPGVNIATGRDGVTVNVRGVTTTDTSSKGEQDIAFNIDGVYVGRGNARSSAFFDIDRIEVLRGPQGTLYGRSSTGGAINVITRAPTFDGISGYIRAEYGNYQAKRAEGAINLPLTDTLAIRLAGSFNDRDGYSKPIGQSIAYTRPGTTTPITYNFPAGVGTARNSQSDATGRASLLFKPTDELSVRLTATIGHQGGSGQGSALETELQKHDDKASGLGILASPVKAYVDSDFQNYDGHLNYEVSGVNVELMGSYQHFKYLQQGPNIGDTLGNGNPICRDPRVITSGAGCNGRGFSFFYQQNNVKTKQTEIRFTNANPGVIDYVVGANYFHERAGEGGQSWVAPIDSPLDTSTYVFSAGPVNTTTHKSSGIFGQATWNISEQFNAVGGLRYTTNEVQRVGRFSLPLNFAASPPSPFGDVAGNAICTFPNACLGGLNPGGSKDHKVTFKAGLNYQLDERNLFYASIASGFKGGTFNDFDAAGNAGAGVPPSSVIAYEIGYKGRPLPGLTYTTSAFYYDFDKYAITGALILPVGGQQGQFTQITPVKFYGWENEFSYNVARDTSFDGSFSFLKTKFVNFVAGQRAALGQGRDFSGQSLDQAPTFTATGGINQSFDLGDRGKVRLRGFLKYSRGYYLSAIASAVRYWQPSFTRSNASISYETSGGKYTLQLFVENIENKVQRISAIGGYVGANALYGGVGGSATTVGNGVIPSNIPANYLNFAVSTPRFYGVRLTAKF